MSLRGTGTVVVIILAHFSILGLVGALPSCETVSTTNQDFLRFARALEDLATSLKESTQATRSHQETLTQLLSVLSEPSTSRCQPPEVGTASHGRTWHQSEAMKVDTAKDKDFERVVQSFATFVTQLGSLRTLETLQLTPQCSPPYAKVGEDCIYIHTDDAKPWYDARAFCRSHGGDLAMPSDVVLLRKHIDEEFQWGMHGNFWVGGSDLETTKGDFRWFNGSVVDDGWDVQRVSVPGGTEARSCVTLTPYSLDNMPCNWSLSFICAREGFQPPAHRFSG